MTSTLEVIVARKIEEASGICSFELISATGGALPRFTAGAHVDVNLGDGLCRQYSLCNNPLETHRYLIGVLLEPMSRGGSRAMHDRVREGDRLTISTPRNLFEIDRAGRQFLLFAGGIGVTPILAMAEALAQKGGDFTMHYCGRSLEHMAFVERLGRSAFAKQVHVHVDNGPASQRFDAGAILAAASVDAHLYVCGPAGFIEAVTTRARQAGFPEAQIHVEHFAAQSTIVEGDTGFDIVLARSSKVIHVGPDESAVEALSRNGIEIETSCEQGICGTCMTAVLEGVPEHRDMYLSQAERDANNVFLPCCSRALGGRLVIDR
ncbi:MAG: PDR/VanB family oxidoreductase [Pusillimonas sp.]